MKNFEPKLIVGDCRNVMGSGEIPEDSVDLICTSPPYNCNIKYDSWNDGMSYDEYLVFMREWLTQAYRVLKDDGRIAVNLFYEISQPGRGGRVFVTSDVWQIMKEIGFQWNGIADLVEDQSERVKYTAWGSWMSASSPYMYNPKECVICAYKKEKKKLTKGVSTIERDEFMESVKGEWNYRAATTTKTQASYSLDIPLRAINLFTYLDDVVLDPFCGRGTTGSACKILGRRFIGVDISKNYIEIANEEIHNIASKWDIDQMFLWLLKSGVFIEEPKRVRKFIERDVKYIPMVRKSILSIHEKFGQEPFEITIEIKHDPDCYKSLYMNAVVSVDDYYSENFMDRIDTINEELTTICDECWDYYVTTDFQPLKTKKE
jgi:site-specific DNA-methyltransferase (adenine-specific)